ncbi:hypothetical protein Dsin_024261 [Dipteronia sinensis]|uniref:Uncharacterized protein n=1 Tax=Dipteronia sinensis TaxID=43782 RepID=A0AAD9ZU51_9ROSI|nr:hypothetical protein Dsin_024261 [Dipteronia sinensis]
MGADNVSRENKNGTTSISSQKSRSYSASLYLGIGGKSFLVPKELKPVLDEFEDLFQNHDSPESQADFEVLRSIHGVGKDWAGGVQATTPTGITHTSDLPCLATKEEGRRFGNPESSVTPHRSRQPTVGVSSSHIGS